MQSDDAETPLTAVFFTHEFKRNLRQLAKKYRRIQKDIQTILLDLQAGNLPGDQIPGVSFEIYKVRARNSDGARGKSGGYRIIYQKTHADTIILLTIYSKTEQSDIAPQEIQAIIQEYEQKQEENQTLNEEQYAPESQVTSPTEQDNAEERSDTEKS